MIKKIWTWLEENGKQLGAVKTIFGLIATLMTIGAVVLFFLFPELEPKNPESGGGPTVAMVTMTLDEFEERQRFLRQQIMSELDRAAPADRPRLQAELDEVNRRLSDSEAALKTEKERVAKLQTELEALRGDISDQDFEEASTALAKGDTKAADRLFARIEDREAEAVSKAARAAFARGEIAEGEVRWADAAEHYAKAARLDPSYDHYIKARAFSWLSGNYGLALAFGEDLIAAATEEFGADTEEHAAALNEHAITLEATGRYTEAEPLFRQAIEIGAKTLGEEHPAYAVWLNNLAALLRATGRLEEAEPLFRQALAILETSLGADHPTTVKVRGNLEKFLEERKTAPE